MRAKLVIAALLIVSMLMETVGATSILVASGGLTTGSVVSGTVSSMQTTNQVAWAVQSSRRHTSTAYANPTFNEVAFTGIVDNWTAGGNGFGAQYCPTNYDLGPCISDPYENPDQAYIGCQVSFGCVIGLWRLPFGWNIPAPANVTAINLTFTARSVNDTAFNIGFQVTWAWVSNQTACEQQTVQIGHQIKNWTEFSFPLWTTRKCNLPGYSYSNVNGLGFVLQECSVIGCTGGGHVGSVQITSMRATFWYTIDIHDFQADLWFTGVPFQFNPGVFWHVACWTTGTLLDWRMLVWDNGSQGWDYLGNSAQSNLGTGTCNGASRNDTNVGPMYAWYYLGNNSVHIRICAATTVFGTGFACAPFISVNTNIDSRLYLDRFTLESNPTAPSVPGQQERFSAIFSLILPLLALGGGLYVIMLLYRWMKSGD